MGGTSGRQSTSSQRGPDLGDSLDAGMAFMNSQQQGARSLESIIKAFVAATQAGELVANTMLQLLAQQGCT